MKRKKYINFILQIISLAYIFFSLFFSPIRNEFHKLLLWMKSNWIQIFCFNLFIFNRRLVETRILSPFVLPTSSPTRHFQTAFLDSLTSAPLGSTRWAEYARLVSWFQCSSGILTMLSLITLSSVSNLHFVKSGFHPNRILKTAMKTVKLLNFCWRNYSKVLGIKSKSLVQLLCLH